MPLSERDPEVPVLVLGVDLALSSCFRVGLRGKFILWGDGDKFADLGRGLSDLVGFDGLLNFIIDSPKGNGDIIRFGLKLPRFISFSEDALRGFELTDDLFPSCKCKLSVGNTPTFKPG